MAAGPETPLPTLGHAMPSLSVGLSVTGDPARM